MAIIAEKMGLDMQGARAQVEKTMATSAPRRIAKLETQIIMPTGIASEHRARLEEVAHKCPVHQSLHPETEKPIHFTWG
jgi:uncharacterized OsmC-like protein